MLITILVGMGFAVASALLTYFLTTHHHMKRVAASSPGEDQVLDLRLDQEFQRGRDAGREDELGKFGLTYEPFVETIEEYLGMKKRSTLGYDMQIHYSGFPIGEPTRRITHNSVEYDEKRIEMIMDSEVAAAVNNIVQLAASKGINAKSLPRPRRQRST